MKVCSARLLTVLFEHFALSSLPSFVAYGNSYGFQLRDILNKQSAAGGQLAKSPSKSWTVT